MDYFVDIELEDGTVVTYHADTGEFDEDIEGLEYSILDTSEALSYFNIVNLEDADRAYSIVSEVYDILGDEEAVFEFLNYADGEYLLFDYSFATREGTEAFVLELIEREVPEFIQPYIDVNSVVDDILMGYIELSDKWYVV